MQTYTQSHTDYTIHDKHSRKQTYSPSCRDKPSPPCAYTQTQARTPRGTLNPGSDHGAEYESEVQCVRSNVRRILSCSGPWLGVQAQALVGVPSQAKTTSDPTPRAGITRQRYRSAIPERSAQTAPKLYMRSKEWHSGQHELTKPTAPPETLRNFAEPRTTPLGKARGHRQTSKGDGPMPRGCRTHVAVVWRSLAVLAEVAPMRRRS